MVLGLLRLLLAVAVVIFHVNVAPFGWKMMGGVAAVQVFFVISGFYMALILHEKYTKGTYKLFITNRFIRIFGPYYVVLIATIVVSVLFIAAHVPLPFAHGIRQIMEHWSSMTWGPLLFIIVSHLCIFGLDLYTFMGLSSTGQLYYSSNQWQHDSLMWMMLIPQAWTLSLELMFYLIAPFVVRWRSWLLALLAAASIGGGYVMLYLGFPFQPSVYRFFPAQVGYFLVGALAYKMYARLKKKDLSAWIMWGTAAILIGCTLFYQYIPGDPAIKDPVYLLLVALSLPIVFRINNPLDRVIGELSYPVYIVHFLIVWLGLWALDAVGVHKPGTMSAILIIILTLGVSYLLYIWVVRPIDRYRQKRAQRVLAGKTPLAPQASP